MPARRTSTTRNRDLVPRSSSKRKKPAAPAPEYIEILSSDEETQPTTPPRRLPPKEDLKQLQQEIQNLKQRYSKLESVEGELERARKEIFELKHASKRSGKILLDAAQLEDHINCEICQTIMWTPYTLVSCGHSFCMTCLVEWFNTCLAQHMTAHPGWRSSNQPAYHHLNPRIRAHPYIAAMVVQQGPQPEFSCPTCRCAVATKPIEDYSLKAIIHTLATSVGETSPKKDPLVVKRRGKGKAKAVADYPFDVFFGKDG
ncbi:hypothetical protein B0H19DRAFT_29307 [Mycena capillaripes]|nr:hypothetical protein B0H19DRAFT_29307 [Mycena capillaripes]